MNVAYDDGLYVGTLIEYLIGIAERKGAA